MTLDLTFVSKSNICSFRIKRGIGKNMLNAVSNLEETDNDLRSFREYLIGRIESQGEDSLRDALTGVQYTYDLDLQIFTENVDGDIIRSDTRSIMEDLMTEYVGMNYTPGTASSSGSGNTSFISLLTPGSSYSSQRLPPTRIQARKAIY